LTYAEPPGPGAPPVRKVTDVAIDAAGDFHIVDRGESGGFQYELGLRKVAAPKAGGAKIVVEKKLGVSGLELYTVMAEKDGLVVLTGRFEGALDFGSGPIQSLGAHDVFLARLAP
jgi:hypothetical protein